jgi:hypothetical protein
VALCGVTESERLRHDTAPTEAGAVPGTSLPSDHACIFNVLAQANLDRNFPSGMGDRRVGT